MLDLLVFHIPSASSLATSRSSRACEKGDVEKELANHQSTRDCSPPVPMSLWEVTRAENSLVYTGMSWVRTRDGVVSLGVQQPTGKGEDPRFVCLPKFSPEPRDAPQPEPRPIISFSQEPRTGAYVTSQDQSGAWLMTVNRDLSPGQADKSQRNFSRTRDSI